MRRARLGVALGFIAALAFTGSTQAFTGAANGSFETGTYADGGGGFQQLDAPNTNVDGWSVDSGSVDWVGTYWTAPDGAMSLDLSGADAGSISQTFDTTIGNTYTVAFLLSGNPAGPPSLKTLEVSATGGTTGLYSHDTTGSDLTSMVWSAETYTFLATSASTTITFQSTTSGPYGPALDAVVVSETVPTKDECKDGGWQSMIDNAGNSFKNQGDCVSYFATKGKNLGAVPPATPTEAATTTDAATTPAKHATKHVEKSTANADRHADKSKSKGETKKSAAKSHAHGGKKHK
jgi:choice-of-anchor C domain-containing protein